MFPNHRTNPWKSVLWFGEFKKIKANLYFKLKFPKDQRPVVAGRNQCIL